MIYEIKTTVLKNQKIGKIGATYQMELECPEVAKEAKPGQFIIVKCGGGILLRRPFSIAGVEKERFISLFYKTVGPGTEWLAQAQEGDILDIRGPLGGRGFTINPEIKNPILVAGGIGVAPLIFLARSLYSLGHTEPLFLIGAKDGSSIIWPPIFGVRMATEDGSLGYKGTVTELLEQTLSQERQVNSTMIYAVGPRPMLKVVAEIAKKHQIPCEVSLETILACDVGACLGCAISTTSGNQRVCKDGPVFDAAKVVWDKYVVPSQETKLIFPKKPVPKCPARKEKAVNLAVTIGNVELKNPVMPASGTFGYGEEFTDLVDLGALGAIITKGITLEPRDGADQPRLCEIPQGMINRIGLQNPGAKKFVAEKMPFLRTLKLPIIVNICGSTVEEYQKLAEILDAVEDIAAIQINISCPNTEKGGMAFGQSPEAAFEVVSVVREATSLPLITKLTPAVTSIVQIAEAAVEAGTNALSAINTIPALGFVNGQIILGGQSGPGIKHIALRFIYELARAKLGVPLIACGGIMTWQDVVEFLMVGAQAVEIGTATFVNPKTMEEVIKGLISYLKREGIKDIHEIIGTALN